MSEPSNPPEPNRPSKSPLISSKEEKLKIEEQHEFLVKGIIRYIAKQEETLLLTPSQTMAAITDAKDRMSYIHNCNIFKQL